MKIEYDPDVDALYVRLNDDSEIVESAQVERGIVLDYNDKGNVVGIEVLNVSKQSTAAKPLKAAA